MKSKPLTTTIIEYLDACPCGKQTVNADIIEEEICPHVKEKSVRRSKVDEWAQTNGIRLQRIRDGRAYTFSKMGDA